MFGAIKGLLPSLLGQLTKHMPENDVIMIIKKGKKLEFVKTKLDNVQLKKSENLEQGDLSELLNSL